MGGLKIDHLCITHLNAPPPPPQQRSLSHHSLSDSPRRRTDSEWVEGECWGGGGGYSPDLVASVLDLIVTPVLLIQ